MEVYRQFSKTVHEIVQGPQAPRPMTSTRAQRVMGATIAGIRTRIITMAALQAA